MPSPFPKVARENRGQIHNLAHQSTVLQSNALGDPSARDLLVYTPPGYADSDAEYPAVFVLPGFTGTGEKLLARGLTDISLATRIDRLIESGCPPFVAVLPDCMTSLGGSQYMDSDGLGAYASYLVDELRQAVDAAFRTTGKWGVIGHSSGGFAALHLSMTHPGAFQAAACHAGDLGFDLCYLGDLPRAVAAVNRAGGVAAFLDGFWEKRRPSGDDISALNVLCMSCAYTPDPDAVPLPARYPVDFETGAVDHSVLADWAALDPIVRVEDPTQRAGLEGLDLLFIDAGRFDEYNLQLGARRLVAALERHGVTHVYEEFDGGHRGTSWRYGVSMAYVAEALSV